MMVRALLFWLLLLCCAQVRAQQPYSYSITTEQGLPSREVYRIVQDDDGFIWIGCNAGLFRYDGEVFKPYRNAKQTGRAMSNLKFDPQGRLWCGSFTGQLFFVENDSLHLFTDWSEHEKQFPQYCFGADGQVWVTSDSGLYVLSAQGKVLQTALFPSNARHAYRGVESVECLPNGDIIAYSQHNGAFIVRDGKAHWMPMQSELAGMLDGRCFFSITKDGTQALLDPERKGPRAWVVVRNDSLLLKEKIPFEERINYLSTSSNGQLWMCMNAGARLMGATTTYFPTDRISDVIVDCEGSMWATSLENGIRIVPTLDVQYYPKEQSALKDANLSTLGVDADGHILLGHFSGRVSMFDQKSKKVTLLLQPDAARHRAVERIVVDKEGNTIIPRGPLLFLPSKKENMVGANAKDVQPWSADTLLIATIYGLNFLPLKTADVSQRVLLREGACRKVVVGKDRTIWAAFKDGLFVGKRESLASFIHNKERVFAADLIADGAGGVWIATIAKGVVHCEANGAITELTTTNGLASNTTRALFLANDTLWVAHDKGIDRVVNGKCAHFGLLDGLNVTEANDIIVHHGQVLVATHDGLVTFLTALDPMNATPPRLRLMELRVRDSIFSASDLLHLDHSQNELQMDIAVLAFRCRGAAVVRYRMLGLDTVWTQQMGNRTEVLFRALPPGNYIFEAVAENEDGVPSLERISLPIFIAQPYWQTWWFLGLMLLLVAAIVSGLFMLRIRQIRRKAALEKQVAVSQLTALKAQMNPHFLFNALNSIQELILQKDVANGLKYLGKFGSLTRQILETSGQEQVTLQAEVDMLSNYLELEKLRFGDSFSYTLDISTDIDPEGILIPPMLIQPYVENALKHGLLHRQTDRRLSITFRMEGEILNVTVTDNGIGRKAASEIVKRQSGHRSFSTSATAKRLELLRTQHGAHGRVETRDMVENGVALGTEVHLRIPSITA